jgi:hypothetical protein
MTEPLTLATERVDDMPLLLAQLERMGLQPLLDQYFPTHGNWVGLSLGWVSVLWLTHIGVPLSSEQKRTLSRKRLNMLDLGLTQKWRFLPHNSFRYELCGFI